MKRDEVIYPNDGIKGIIKNRGLIKPEKRAPERDLLHLRMFRFLLLTELPPCTKPNLLAAVNLALNLTNVIYEEELSVTLSGEQKKSDSGVRRMANFSAQLYKRAEG